MTHIPNDDRHPSDDELTLHVDGELQPESSSWIVEHLEACWRCRTRVERFQEAIRTFTDFVDGRLSRRIPSPPNGWMGFALALRRESEQPVTRGIPGMLRRSVRHLWSQCVARPAILRPVPVLSVLLVAIAAWVFIVRAPHVSAAELLHASRTAERAWLARPASVVHRTLSLEERRLPENVVVRTRRVEVWQHGERGVIVRRAYAPDNRIVGGEWIERSDVRTLYRPGAQPGGVGFDPTAAVRDPEQVWRLELSAITFSALASVEDARVARSGNRVILSWARDASEGLTRVELTLASDSLRPISQTLTVQDLDSGAREYRFHEISTVEMVSAEAAAHFEPEPDLLPPASTADRLVSHAPIPAGVPETVPTPSNPQLESLELDGWYRAHLLGLLFGTDVDLSRTPAGIQMRLRISNEMRRSALLTRLAPWAQHPLASIAVDGPSRDTPSMATPPEAVIGDAPLFSTLLARVGADLPREAAIAAARGSVTAVHTQLERLRAHVAALRAFTARWPVPLAEHSNDEVTHWVTIIRGQALALGDTAEQVRTLVLGSPTTDSSCPSLTSPMSSIDEVETGVATLLRASESLAKRLHQELTPSSSIGALAQTPTLPAVLCEVEASARVFAGPMSFER